MIQLKIQQIRFNIDVIGEMTAATEEILTPEALEFLYCLHENFNGRRKALLAAREVRQRRLENGEKLDFLRRNETYPGRDWTVAPIPQDLQDRRVEITGPVDRKMIINALNSGAKAFMADFEDATSPTWENLIDGQLNLKDAVRRTISFEQATTGKTYALNEETAVLMVRARGLHLDEKHILIDGEPMAGGFFDFGLYFFHNAKELIEQRYRSVFLFAEARKPFGSEAVE